MTFFDKLAEKRRDESYNEWEQRVLDSKGQIATFVASRRPGRGAEVLDWFEGSFNFCLQVTYNDGTPDTVIRFPGPGHTTFQDEKILNELQVIQFLQHNTTTPVPRLISWGLTEDRPQHFGPFAIRLQILQQRLQDVPDTRAGIVELICKQPVQVAQWILKRKTQMY